jgi:hypothetical protein
VLTDRREELGNRAQLNRPAHHTDGHVPIMTAPERDRVSYRVRRDRIAVETKLT